MNRLFSFLAALAVPLSGVCPTSANTIDVRTLALRADNMPEGYIKTAKDFLPLQFSSVQPTGIIRALAANPLPLYRTEVDAKGKTTYVVTQKVKLPVGARGILLLGWTEGDKERYVAIKDDFAAANYNDWLLINACSRPVAFKAGEKTKPILLKPGVSITHRISTAKDEGTAFIAQAPFDGKQKVFFSTYWPVYAGKRSVVLFVDDGAKIRVKRISDQLAMGITDKTSG